MTSKPVPAASKTRKDVLALGIALPGGLEGRCGLVEMKTVEVDVAQLFMKRSAQRRSGDRALQQADRRTRRDDII